MKVENKDEMVGMSLICGSSGALLHFMLHIFIHFLIIIYLINNISIYFVFSSDLFILSLVLILLKKNLLIFSVKCV